MFLAPFASGESFAVIRFWHDSADTVNRFHITVMQRDAAKPARHG